MKQSDSTNLHSIESIHGNVVQLAKAKALFISAQKQDVFQQRQLEQIDEMMGMLSARMDLDAQLFAILRDFRGSR